MEEADSEDGLIVRTYFVRNRNALVARAAFDTFYIDYYLGLADRGLRFHPEQDQWLKDAVAAMALHCASRPWNETVAWTIHFSDPLLNLFVTGDNKTGRLIGNLFTENVRNDRQNVFYSDVIKGMEPVRRSVVPFTGNDPFAAVEQFYLSSEQRPARLFRLEDEDFVMITAQPDCDMDWFNQLDLHAMPQLDRDETLRLLETRTLKWECGCSAEQLILILARSAKVDIDALFAGDAAITTTCPRCGAKHRITREEVSAFLKRQ